ncbi:GNAT family N-acetyltransferase [Rhizobium puerariae]|uniref:GNAT family N-acetyltransferase n=1 Tax=Rhizobium puerariae TaxID=1585791 RepID=A0ABV6AAC1_9HYPH
MADLLIRSSLRHPAARPLIDGLMQEHDQRYGEIEHPDGNRSQILQYPEALYAPPLGDFLLLQRDGRTIAGGAFVSHDDETVELKRIWADPILRRQGLARRIVLALEDSAVDQGYVRVYLSTGFRQPEAVGLYLSLGYRPLFDPSADPTLYRSLSFEKYIGKSVGKPYTTPVCPPAASFDEATARIKALKDAQDLKIMRRLQCMT